MGWFGDQELYSHKSSGPSLVIHPCSIYPRQDLCFLHNYPGCLCMALYYAALTHFALKMCSFLTQGLKNWPFCLFSGALYCCMSPTQFALWLVTEMQYQIHEKYSLSTPKIFKRLSWGWAGENDTCLLFVEWDVSFNPFFKISAPLNKIKTEVKLKDFILELAKCFKYICCLCTKKGSRHKTPISSI